MSDAKNPQDRQRANVPAVLGASAGIVAPPDPPSDLSPKLRAAWAGLWASPVAQLIDPVSDLPALERLFSLYTLGDQLADALAAGIPGSETFATTAAVRLRAAAETRQLESALGLSPRSRLALGLALLAGRKAGSLDDAAEEADAGD